MMTSILQCSLALIKSSRVQSENIHVRSTVNTIVRKFVHDRAWLLHRGLSAPASRRAMCKAARPNAYMIETTYGAANWWQAEAS